MKIKKFFSEATPFLFATLCWLAFWLSGCNVWKSEVVVYKGFCPTPLQKNACESGEEAAAVFHYAAHPDTETVVYWVDDSPPSKYDNCAISDNKNWSCKLRVHGDEVDFQMTGGEFKIVDPLGNSGSVLETQFYQIPKWRWWMLHVKNL